MVRWVGLLAAILVAGALSGLIIASWVDQAPAILMSMVQSGMAWCF